MSATATMKPVKPGERYRVKRDWFTRDFGFRASSATSPDDNKAWPGEIGVIEEIRWIAWDDSEVSDIAICFERGRRRFVDSDGTFGDDSKHLIKVR